MRRTAAALALTAIGLFFVLSYKSAPLSHVASVSATDATPTTAPAASDENGGAAAAGGSPGPTPTTTTRPSPTGGATRTMKGPVVTTRYGDVQVEVILSGSRITDVKGLQLPYDRARSQYISQQVAPILHQEVLDAQNAQIDTVSGATYTSEAYAQSLQAALDQARAG